MNVNGIRMFSRGAFSSSTTALEPAAVSIQIGKGLKGKSVEAFASSGKTLPFSLDKITTATAEYGTFVIYDERTGILTLDCATLVAGGAISASGIGTDPRNNTTRSSGYLVINASKSPALTGVPLLQPRIATIKDVKANGTDGGTFTSGAWQTRTLNTLEDPTGIVTGLASNQITLSRGTYYIEAEAPAYYVGRHKARLRNITDSVDVIVGSTASVDTTNGFGTTTLSNVTGTFTISSPKTFTLEHRCDTTRATNGFGLSSGFGVNEVYAQVKITKVRD
jgi:hypothetical protein